MDNEKPIIDGEFQLIRTEGKGGWTFVEIPNNDLPKKPFGMLRVRGRIDNYEFSGHHLMPIGNGNLGLPLKASIRRIIKKQSPDSVYIIIYLDHSEIIIPDEFIDCLRFEDGALAKFNALTTGQKKAFIDWIYAAKSDEVKVQRISKTIEMILGGKMY